MLVKIKELLVKSLLKNAPSREFNKGSAKAMVSVFSYCLMGFCLHTFDLQFVSVFNLRLQFI